MTVTIVVGAQWGDEGKGRVVDYLAACADMVVRFQGGDNAGHTVVNDYGRFALHLIPCGVFNPRVRCLLGPGTVVNLDTVGAKDVQRFVAVDIGAFEDVQPRLQRRLGHKRGPELSPAPRGARGLSHNAHQIVPRSADRSQGRHSQGPATAKYDAHS